MAQSKLPNAATPEPDRRQVLTRLGLAAVTAYAAPTLITLTPARASGGSYSAPSHSGPSGSGGGRRTVRSSSSGPSGSRRSSGSSRRSSRSARRCSFSGGSGSANCGPNGQVRPPRFLRRLFGGSG